MGQAMSVFNQFLPSNWFESTSHAELNQLFQKAASVATGWYPAESDIQGTGVFASRPYEAGEVIGVALTPSGEDEYGAKIWNLTALARYCNHQFKNNVELKKKDDQFVLIAKKPIQPDDELVSNYAQVSTAIGPHSRMHWEGKPVPNTDFSDYIEKEAAFEFVCSGCGCLSGECPGCTSNIRLIPKVDYARA